MAKNFDEKDCEKIREIVGACNDSLLTKLAVKEFTEKYVKDGKTDIERMAKVVGENREDIKYGRIEVELATYKKRKAEYEERKKKGK